jgi:hypothetical protein
MKIVIMLSSVFYYCYDECHYAECLYGECRGAKNCTCFVLLAKLSSNLLLYIYVLLILKKALLE